MKGHRISLLAVCLLVGCDGTAATGSTTGTGDGGTVPVWTYGSTVSNVPAHTFTVTKSDTATDLELLSSNLAVHLFNDGGASVEWFGEVRNNGSTPTCSTKIDIKFLTAERFGVAAMSSFAYGEPYQSQSRDVILPCVAPGKTGVAWGIDIPALAPEISTIDVIEVQLASRPEDVVPAPSAPMLSGVGISQDSTLGMPLWAITGKLTATETIHNIAMKGYFKADNGLVVLRATDVNLETVNAGASWNWKAIGFRYEGPKPASFLLSLEYLRGAKM